MRTIFQTAIILWLYFAPVFVSGFGHAQTEAERKELTRLLDELKHLDRIITRAEALSDEQARWAFDYTGLEEDLHKVRQGIAGYLNRERRDPRTLPPISGEY